MKFYASSGRLTCLLLYSALCASAQPITATAHRQIAALLAEKAARNPAQQKIDSHLLHAAAIVRGRPVHPDFPSPPGELESVRPDRRNFVDVDITARVTPALLATIGSAGGSVISAFPEYRAIRARLPLVSVEQIAARAEVSEIRTADPGHANAADRSKPARAALGRLRRALNAAFFAGPATTGDVAHQANLARAIYGVDGTGIKIGVLSDGVNSLTVEQNAGRLPTPVNIIPGQGGNGDEGTAMLEIVYTLAPGATLYFATSTGGQARMANNIQLLANAGCQIIIDDWTYFAEGVFQDDIIARKVEAVAATGVFFFSDAQNSGSLLKGNSGTWEGDFADSGAALPDVPAIQAIGGALHNFGTAANVVAYDSIVRVTQNTSSFVGAYELKWSDPLGGSTNDYDLFILDANMTTVLGSSTRTQNGTQNPEEYIGASTNIPAGARILILKRPSAAVRAIHLDTERGILALGTTGATFGHNAAANLFTMAAVNASSAAGGAFTGGASNSMLASSSDGPRRIFFHGDGTPIVPDNLLFATDGGTVLPKPDFTAANGVSTGVPGYTMFFGTSAAAPHAGAIAALVLQARPGLTLAQLRTAFTSSALAIEGQTPNINAGGGIIMAPVAVLAVLQSPVLTVAKTHTGDFTQGQSAASYQVTVSNTTGTGPSAGTLTVTDTLPEGLTLVSMSGSGWTCAANSCSRSDALAAGASFAPVTVVVRVAANAPAQVGNNVSLTSAGAVLSTAADPTTVVPPQPPVIYSGGVVTLASKSSTISPGSWASIFGSALANSAVTWNSDYPTSLGGVSVTVNGKPAYLWYVSPGQINMQTPDDTARGPVSVVVTTPGGTATSTITLADVSPSLNLLDATHVAAVILTGGTYDIVGPVGAFSFNTRPVKAGETLLLYGTGFGPTIPAVPAGHVFSGAAATTNAVQITIAGKSVTPIYAVAYASGAYQIALTVPSLPSSGDQAISLTVAGSQTPLGATLTVH